MLIVVETMQKFKPFPSILLISQTANGSIGNPSDPFIELGTFLTLHLYTLDCFHRNLHLYTDQKSVHHPVSQRIVVLHQVFQEGFHILQS